MPYPHASVLSFLTPVPANNIHSSSPYIHPRLGSQIGPRDFPIGTVSIRSTLSSYCKSFLGSSINGLVTDGNTKLCCRGFVLVLFQIVGPICNNFEKNRAFYDKSMKLGTWLVDNKTKKIKGQCHAENVL